MGEATILLFSPVGETKKNPFFTLVGFFNPLFLSFSFYIFFANCLVQFHPLGCSFQRKTADWAASISVFFLLRQRSCMGKGSFLKESVCRAAEAHRLCHDWAGGSAEPATEPWRKIL